MLHLENYESIIEKLNNYVLQVLPSFLISFGKLCIEYVSKIEKLNY